MSSCLLPAAPDVHLRMAARSAVPHTGGSGDRVPARCPVADMPVPTMSGMAPHIWFLAWYKRPAHLEASCPHVVPGPDSILPQVPRSVAAHNVVPPAPRRGAYIVASPVVPRMCRDRRRVVVDRLQEKSRPADGSPAWYPNRTYVHRVMKGTRSVEVGQKVDFARLDSAACFP